MDCNIVNNNFSDFFNDDSTPFKENRHIDQKNRNLDLQDLIKLRKEFENNPAIGYLNINHLRSKTDDLRDICSKSPIDVLCIDETKSGSYYPDSQL